MPTLTPGQIVDALAQGQVDRLIGNDESEQVDFKLAPYLLDTDERRWELAKDVAAFANRGWWGSGYWDRDPHCTKRNQRSGIRSQTCEE